MIIYNLCNQINGKYVDMLIPAAIFDMCISNSKCPQISSYDIQLLSMLSIPASSDILLLSAKLISSLETGLVVEDIIFVFIN